MEALIIVDVQNDFCPGGALGVKNGDQIIPVINQLSSQFNVVVQTQDWHPKGHSSFASSHESQKPYDRITMDYGEQVLWPDHCVQGSDGAAFHSSLETKSTELIIRKGMNPDIDSYSAFYENDQITMTGLSGYLKEMAVDTLFICGLATDFCVKWSAIDGVKKGFNVFVIEDATKGIDLDNSVKKAWEEMEEYGVKSIKSHEL